jgi:hypothetical protein
MKVVVERCGVEWWKATERTSEIWSDAKAHWGQYLWSDVIARQVTEHFPSFLHSR